MPQRLRFNLAVAVQSGHGIPLKLVRVWAWGGRMCGVLVRSDTNINEPDRPPDSWFGFFDQTRYRAKRSNGEMVYQYWFQICVTQDLALGNL